MKEIKCSCEENFIFPILILVSKQEFEGKFSAALKQVPIVMFFCFFSWYMTSAHKQQKLLNEWP